jgi:hypothetical protein
MTTVIGPRATPRGVVYGAFRRLRGASKATFRDPLFILWFMTRHFHRLQVLLLFSLR